MDKISWTTVEYLHKEKTSDWYWVVAIITISIALISIILNNIIFALLIIVSAFILSLFASKRPEQVVVTLDNLGVMVGRNRHSYKDLESFWVETRDFNPRILLKSKKIIMPFIVIMFDENDYEKIHDFLLEHLPEEEHTEPLLEKLLLYFGF